MPSGQSPSSKSTSSQPASNARPSEPSNICRRVSFIRDAGDGVAGSGRGLATASAKDDAVEAGRAPDGAERESARKAEDGAADKVEAPARMGAGMAGVDTEPASD